MARLDQIERTMAQLSPRVLSIDLEDDPPTGPTLSPTHLSPSRLAHVPPPSHNPPPSPPRLTLNGVATSAPPTFSNFPHSNGDSERQKQDSRERGRHFRRVPQIFPMIPIPSSLYPLIHLVDTRPRHHKRRPYIGRSLLHHLTRG